MIAESAGTASTWAERACLKLRNRSRALLPFPFFFKTRTSSLKHQEHII